MKVDEFAPSPLELYLQAEEVHRILEIIRKEPARIQRAIALYYVNEMTWAAIGRTIGVSGSRAQQLVYECLCRVRGAAKKQQEAEYELLHREEVAVDPRRAELDRRFKKWLQVGCSLSEAKQIGVAQNKIPVVLKFFNGQIDVQLLNKAEVKSLIRRGWSFPPATLEWAYNNGPVPNDLTEDDWPTP